MSTARKPPSRNPATRAAAENRANGTPVTFDLDAYQAEAVHEPFSFRLQGRTFTLPHISCLDWHVVKGDDGGVVIPSGHELIRAGLGDQWAAFDKLELTGDGYGELQRRWLKHSGIDLGEDGASQT